jgi:hypothetical protein
MNQGFEIAKGNNPLSWFNYRTLFFDLSGKKRRTGKEM